MENKQKIIIGSFIGAFIILTICFLISGNITLNDLTPKFLDGIVSASSENPEDERPIGYEFLDNNSVVHIWNNATVSDYYFDKDSGIQLTNHYEDYWTKNIFCIGFYNNDEWHKIKCADELTNFQKSIESDDLTYVSATLQKDISFIKNEIEYNMELKVNYYLGLNDENLSITISGKNTGIDIPVDLGFAWKVTDWDIPSNETDDYLEINGSGYNTKGTYDLTFKDMEESYFKGRDSTYDFGGEFLRVDWNKNLNYAVKMFGNGIQEDFYVALLINAGHFNPQQEKQTTFQWIDALVLGTNVGFVTVAPTEDPAGTNTGFGPTHSISNRDTSPAGAVKVIEIGFWINSVSTEGNCEVGIYDWDTGNNRPGNLIGVSRTNASGTGGNRWFVVSGLNITITANTVYGIAMQTDGYLQVDYTSLAGERRDYKSASGSLPDPWGTTSTGTTLRALYALVEEAPTDETPPTYSNAQTNTTIAGASVLFSILYNDDTALEPDGQYIFSTNNTGTWINDTTCGGTLDCSTYGIEASCNNCSECSWEISEPDYTSRTCSGVWGASCEGEDPELGDYSYDGCESGGYFGTGFWVDEVYVNATSAKIGDTIKITCNYDCYSTSPYNDLAISYYNGTWNQIWKQDEECIDGNYSVDVVVSGDLGEQKARCQIGYDNNNPTGTCFTVDYADNDDVNFTVVPTFFCNETGTCSTCALDECMTNCSDAGCLLQGTNFIATPSWANVTKTLNSTSGLTIGYRWYANDSAGNINNTEIFYVEITAGDTCTYTSGTWAVDCSDYCNITSEVDLAGEDITIIGDGEFTTTKDISNFGELYISGGAGFCDVKCIGGCFV